MKKINLFVLIVAVLLPSIVSAQKNEDSEQINESRRRYYYNYSRWSIGVNGGASALWGDFSTFSEDKTYLSPIGGLQVTLQVNPYIGFSAEGSIGKNRISATGDNAAEYLNPNGYHSPTATDANTNTNFLKYNDLYADVEVYQGRVGLDLNLNNIFAGNKGDKLRKVSVILSPSYYLQYYRPTVYKKSDNARYSNRDLHYENTSGVGGEIAARFRASRIVDFQVKGGGVYGFNEKFDGVAGDNSNNIMAYVQAGVIFKLNGKTKRDNLIYAATPKYVPMVEMVETQRVVDAKEPTVIERVIHDTVYVDRYVEKETDKKAIKIVGIIPYVSFERGESVMDEVKYKQKLDAIVEILDDNPSITIDIYGWADHTGSDGINVELTTERAEALRNYLVKRGIDANRIKHVEGKGKDTQLTGDAAFSAKARRAEIIID
ncbi:MAG: OmpA family protein [Dysgonamonadaceae bacterium]|nr:OmpA family protein [Dysgonamonadaceae bacterium]